ncbi:hypothetical protein [Streptomyces sp. NPDC055094]
MVWPCQLFDSEPQYHFCRLVLLLQLSAVALPPSEVEERQVLSNPF